MGGWEQQGTSLYLLFFLTLFHAPSSPPPAEGLLMPFPLFKPLQSSHSCTWPSAGTSSSCRQIQKCLHLMNVFMIDLQFP